MQVFGIASRTALKAVAAKVFPRAKASYTVTRWEREYAGGEWERLRQIGEVPHYGVIAGYVRHYARRGRILDVGCGEGILQEVLGRDSYRRYLGVDLAREAVLRALAREDDRTAFEQADAAVYAPQDEFDVIVFNEVLYYFEAPEELMARYEAHVAAGGATIVSMVVDRRSFRVWRKIERTHSPEAEVLVANRTGSWVVKAYPSAPPGRHTSVDRRPGRPVNSPSAGGA